jgi:MoaA/NifB/PqqE/SkfB family radical SAM enzyme
VIELLARLPGYKCFRRFGYPRLLPASYTVSVTYRCNSRCATCRVYEKQAPELSVDEYERIFKSVGRSPYWITISGGEPFLRRDIVRICRIIYEYCRPAIINIPTNGILYDIIPPAVAEIAEGCPQSKVIINLSLDEVGERHDKLRGVKGNYERTRRTYQALRGLKLANLTLGIHTVISRHNVARFPRIYEALIAWQPDSYITEVAEERVELGTTGLGITPKAEEYGRAIDYLIQKMNQSAPSGVSRITQAFRRQYYAQVVRVLKEGRGVLPCYAAIASCQIAPNGDVWPCCIKAEVMGNLREVDYDFRRLWFSNEAGRLRRKIKRDNCFCPLANASYTNMLCDFKSLAKAGWWWLRARRV